jgi:chemotaxis protein CheX
MKAEFFNPFLRATVKVLSTMANITPKAGKPGIKKGDIAQGGIIGLGTFGRIDACHFFKGMRTGDGE